MLHALELRHLTDKDQIPVVPHMVFQQGHDVRAASDVGGVFYLQNIFQRLDCHTHSSSFRWLGRIINLSHRGRLFSSCPLA